MKNTIGVIVLFVMLTHSLVVPQINGQGKVQTFQKSLGSPSVTRFNINNISTLIYNNGISDLNGSNSGFYFPKNSNKTAVYCGGLLWGAFVNDKILSGGSSYRSGLTPGRILENGLPEDPNSDLTKIFRVRKDYKQADLTFEVLDMSSSTEKVYAQYETDWNEWPAQFGAPFKDVDGDKKYNPNIDIPGIPDADQTIWFVANDLDTAKSKLFYGTSPMNVEVQCTIWGYNRNDFLGNCLFKEYRLINKSKNIFKNMYIGEWSDVDIGGGAYDLPGCDSLMNLGYMYVGKIPNSQYANIPPAVGFFLIKGPTVGKKDLNMTAIGRIYKNSGPAYSDPDMNSYNGTISLYYTFQGLLNNGTGHPLLASMGKGTTKFPYSGDPVNGTGFVAGVEKLFDGQFDNPADYRIMICSGPFNMAPGDTQRIKFAEIAALGADRLTSVSLLKEYTRSIAKMYNITLPVDVKKETTIPDRISLYQNYPNPFNPSTTIKYSLPNNQFVSIKIFDLLGREIITLVNEQKLPGTYVLKFDGSDLTSGVYFYRMQCGSYSETRKFVLMK